MSVSKLWYTAMAALLLAFAGCSDNPYRAAGADYPSANTIAYGTVDSIEVGGPARSGPGLGAAVGAIAGGVLGNQIGHGTGRAAATVGGAVAGGVVGNEAEKRMGGETQGYRIRVRLDNGTTQLITQSSDEGLRVGQRVRIDNGHAYPL
jgi:outer membrane lipoprotein SlyB